MPNAQEKDLQEVLSTEVLYTKHFQAWASLEGEHQGQVDKLGPVC